jgi:hypothetical protein
MPEHDQPRYTPGEFLQRLIEQATAGPVAYTSGSNPQIVVMLYETYVAMRDRIEELERILEIKRGGTGGGFIPLADILRKQQDSEPPHES